MKIYFTYLMLTVSLFCLSQMATVDAATNAKLTIANTHLAAMKAKNTENFIKNSKILVEAENTVSNLNKMQETYNEWSQAVRVVNGAFQNGKEIINIAEHIGDIARVYERAVRLISREDELTNTQKSMYILVFVKLALRSSDEFAEAKAILTNGMFEMNDSERLILLRKIENKIAGISELVTYAYRKMRFVVRESKNVRRDRRFLEDSFNAVKG